MIFFKSGGSGNELRVEHTGLAIHVEQIAINIRNSEGVGLSVWLNPDEAIALARAVWTDADAIKNRREEKPKKGRRRNG